MSDVLVLKLLVGVLCVSLRSLELDSFSFPFLSFLFLSFAAEEEENRPPSRSPFYAHLVEAAAAAEDGVAGQIEGKKPFNEKKVARRCFLRQNATLTDKRRSDE